MRLARVRDQQTDYLFSQYLSFELFEQIVWEVLRERGVSAARAGSLGQPGAGPAGDGLRAGHDHRAHAARRARAAGSRLKESKVVIIRTLISDQLGYINVAKEWFTVEDLAEIRRRKIGTGASAARRPGCCWRCAFSRIAGGLRLQETACVSPDSYFIGSDVFYTFMSHQQPGALERPEIQDRRRDARRLSRPSCTILRQGPSRRTFWIQLRDAAGADGRTNR